jgi:hypothetical protein
LGSYEFIVSASWPEFDPTDGTICTVLPTVQHYTVEVLAVSGETDTDGSTDSDSSSSTTDG